VKEVLTYIDENRERFIEELMELVAQPSISSYNQGIKECAFLLKGMMERSGIESRIIETPGHPIVYGEIGPEEALFTMLIYGHYDVQPPEPLELWETPPFEPTVRNDRLYGRGTADNKGQLYTHIKATEAHLKTKGSVPIRLKFIFEGEEEILSPSLDGFARDHRELLRSDVVYMADGPGHESLKPTVFFGCRGIVYLELSAKGAKMDYHSGNKGGVLPNPAWDLVHALDTMKDRDDRVLIEGFYDRVRTPSDIEKDALSKIPYDEKAILADLEIAAIAGSRDYSYYEKLLMRPTLTIDGFQSGFTGRGMKTIVPSEGMVKLEARLVPDQDPDEVIEAIKHHLVNHGFGQLKVKVLTKAAPSRTPMDHPFSSKVIRSIEEIHGISPILYPSSGGTLPAYVFTDTLNLPAFWVPYGQNDIQNHAPNENLRLDFYLNGIKTSAVLMQYAGV
jgi:acetylornithine deacetylase/succinyl-diaminopimelate desuccinylase-like protein